MLLIISQSKKLARSVSDTFYVMGILSFGATPHEALSEISSLYRAVLILSPEEMPDIKDYLSRLKGYMRNIPIFALQLNEGEKTNTDLFDGCFSKTTFSPALAKKIIEYSNKNEYTKIGDYRLAGFNACWDNLGVRYFSTILKLTKTETMILRYLIRSYPLPVTSENILKYAFRSGRAPEAGSIRTHISIINKKVGAILGRKIITFSAGVGYVILTPELIYKGNLL